MAKKFVLNEQTMMTLGFVILVVMLLSAMSCGKKENAYFEANNKQNQFINRVNLPNGWITVGNRNECRDRCQNTDGCTTYTYFTRGGFSADPSKNCKLQGGTVGWHDWRTSSRDAARVHGGWVQDWDRMPDQLQSHMTNALSKKGWTRA